MTDFPRKIYERWLKPATTNCLEDDEIASSLMDESLEDSEEEVPYKLEPRHADAENFLNRIRRCGW